MTGKENLNEELMKVVEAHAPAALAKSIKKYVEHAENDKGYISDLKDMLESKNKQIDTVLIKKKDDDKLFEDLKLKFENLEKLFGDKEAFRIEKSDYRLTRQQDINCQLVNNNEKLFDLVKIIFKNQEVKKTVMKQGTESQRKPAKDQYGGSFTETTSSDFDTTETITEETS